MIRSSSNYAFLGNKCEDQSCAATCNQKYGNFSYGTFCQMVPMKTEKSLVIITFKNDKKESTDTNTKNDTQ